MSGRTRAWRRSTRRALFPLLRRRAQFAAAASFRLFDVTAADGQVLEDVFAYTNRAAGERSLVVFHNRWAEAHGSIARSVPFAAGEGREPRTESLAEALGLATDTDTWYATRDLVEGRDHLLHGPTLARDGLVLRLGAFGCQVLLDWQELAADGPWAELAAATEPAGVPDLEAALAAHRAGAAGQGVAEGPAEDAVDRGIIAPT